MPKEFSLSYDPNYVAIRKYLTVGAGLYRHENTRFQPYHPIHPRGQFQIMRGN